MANNNIENKIESLIKAGWTSKDLSYQIPFVGINDVYSKEKVDDTVGHFSQHNGDSILNFMAAAEKKGWDLKSKLWP